MTSQIAQQEFRPSYLHLECEVKENPLVVYTNAGNIICIKANGDVIIWSFDNKRQTTFTKKGKSVRKFNVQFFNFQPGMQAVETHNYQEVAIKLPDGSLVKVTPEGEVSYWCKDAHQCIDISPRGLVLRRKPI